MLYKLTLSSLTFETAALWLLFSQSRSVALMLEYFLLHGIASALMAVAIGMLAPRKYRRQKTLLFALLFSFHFFIPVLSIIAEALAAALYRVMPKLKKKTTFGTVQPPEFNTYRNHEGTGFRSGQARSQLANTNAPVEQRLKALIAVQDTPVRAIGPLLRNLLADPADDVRLLAYGILDSKEKHITRQIVENRQLLEAGPGASRGEPPGPAERFHLFKRIAELYWELIYQNLVQGDMQLFSAEQAQQHALQALDINPGDGGLWFIIARLKLARGDVAGARHALEQSRLNHFAYERLLPYYAELAFLERRFDTLHALLAELENSGGGPALENVKRYWLGDRAGAHAGNSSMTRRLAS